MLILIFSLLFTIPVALFATQNTQVVNIKFFQNTYPSVPLYLIVLISLLIGVSFSWLIHAIDMIYSSWEFRNKAHALKEEKKKSLDLAKQLHKLEIENAELRAKYNSDEVDDKSL